MSVDGLPAIPFLEKIGSPEAQKFILGIEKAEMDLWKDEDRRDDE